jgi:hypothetical protein
MSGGRGFFGGGGSGAGAGGRFVERPGESPPPRPARRGGGAAGAAPGTDTTPTRGAVGAGGVAARPANAAAEEPPLNMELFREVLDLVREPGSLYPPSNRRQPPLVKTGDYLVVMTAGGETHRQPLRVVRTRDIGDDEGGGDEATDDDNP